MIQKLKIAFLVSTAFAMFGCDEDDLCSYYGINYSPVKQVQTCTISIEANYVGDLIKHFGYHSVAIFLDSELKQPWRSYGKNNINWTPVWHMKAPVHCWIVVFIDSEMHLPIEQFQYLYDFVSKTDWDGLPDLGDPYHPDIIEHIAEPGLHTDYILGTYDDTYLWLN